MKIINPATEEIIREVPEDTKETLENKYKELKNGQLAWSKKLIDDRLACVDKFSDLLEKNRVSLSEILTSEMGKPLNQSGNEISGAIKRIKFFLEHSKKWLSEEWMVEGMQVNEKITFESLGVIANISAWNYPYLVGVNVFVPALIAGNSVLYKPSEYTSLTGLEIEKLLFESGIPSNVFKTAIGGKEVGEAMLDLPLDGYFFTGSFKTGQHIAQRVAPKLVPFQLELGGKDPLYVVDDVEDVDKTAAAVADGAFYNNGQSCCAVERIYVNKNIYDQFVEKFVKEVKLFKAGDPTQKNIYVGPLARKEQLELLEEQVEDAVKKGAKLLLGGKRMKGKGYFFEPTVLTGVSHDMAVMREESFGPIIGIQKVDNDEEALKLMNDTEYGLTAAVYSQDKKRANKIFENINTGSVYWNCCDRVSPYLPWSGRKNSGIGSTLSYIGIRAFVRPKGYHLKGTL